MSTPPGAHTIETKRDQAGRFMEGNHGAAIRLLDVPEDKVAPWMSDALKRAERRFRGAKTSGLFKRTSTRLDGILRAACVADAVHDALAAHAVTLSDVKAAREILSDARTWATSGQKAWTKVFALVGVKRGGSGEGSDPLARLAQELGESDGDE